VCFGDNEPYSGRHTHDYTIDFHAEPAGIPHVGIEVRQDLVRTSKGALKWAGILADALTETLANEQLYSRIDAT
jgi:predicted N-formylglutamate amidohydrolase